MAQYSTGGEAWAKEASPGEIKRAAAGVFAHCHWWTERQPAQFALFWNYDAGHTNVCRRSLAGSRIGAQSMHVTSIRPAVRGWKQQGRKQEQDAEVRPVPRGWKHRTQPRGAGWIESSACCDWSRARVAEAVSPRHVPLDRPRLARGRSVAHPLSDPSIFVRPRGASRAASPCLDPGVARPSARGHKCSVHH